MRRRARLPLVASACALLVAGCSSDGSPREPETSAASPSRAAEPYTGYPDSVAALGHSAVTGEGTPSGATGMTANSWATGDNPQVDSIYLRILAEHPEIEGHAINLGEGSADVASLARQAQSLIAEDPQPQLVLIATLDADITCPASQDDVDAYGDALHAVLEDLADGMPGSRFFVTTQISTPTQDARIYSRRQRATFGGTGPCDFVDPHGDVVPEALDRLETAIAGFEQQVSDACSQAVRCATDQSGRGWRMRAAYSDDLNHLNLEGQARWAEYVWGRLQDAQLVPPT